MSKKAIGYVRVSTTKQDLDRQKNMIEEFCIYKNYRLIKIISDQVSGAELEREGYLELLETKKNDADIIVMTEVSRLSRVDDVVEPLGHINTMLRKGIDIVFLENNIYNSRVLEGGRRLTITEVLTLVIELDAAAKERRKIVGRMMSGRKSKFLSFPNMCIGKVPFGYAKVDNPNYTLHVTPKSFLERNENADVVRNIFEWIIGGSTLKDVALRLQQMGIKSNRGADFDTSLVSNIVHNEIYKGVWRFSGRIIKGDAIVDEDTWLKAQEALKSNRLKNVIRNVNFNPLKGILKCPCGKSMYIVTNRTKSNRVHKQYRCAVKKNRYNETICNNGGADVDVILNAVWNAVSCSISNKEFLNKSNDEIKRIDEEIALIKKNISFNEKKLKEIQKQQQSLSKAIGKAENERLFEMLSSQFEQLVTEENSIIETNKKNNDNKIQYEALKRQLSSKTVIENPTDEEKARLYQQLLSKVVYYSEVMHRGFLVIDFKNGLRLIYLILVSQKKSYIQMPNTFKFNEKTRKVVVESYKSVTTGTEYPFSFDSQVNEYNTVEVEKNFPDICNENRLH
ncbi:MAG: recombinase family protein [Bacteroidales bacterium]|nr:recombinase family protein [Bacteroidales bacterium]